MPTTELTREGTPAGAPSLERLRVIVADGDPLARRVMRDVFQNGAGFVVTAEAADGVEAVELALHYRPEVVLMEAVLPRLDRVSATPRILERAQEVKVVIFSARAIPTWNSRRCARARAASSPRSSARKGSSAR